MNVEIHPHPLQGCIQVPTSKSLAHRAIICAALAKGTSKIFNVSLSKDIEATIQSMQSLGARIQIQDDCCIVEGIQQWQSGVCDCNESGSTLRFLIPIAATQSISCDFTGKHSLFSRPMTIYKNLFQRQNIDWIQDANHIHVHGGLHADVFEIPGNISSQFISGMLMACPLMEKESVLKILPPFESKSYVDLTIYMLKQFGIQIHPIDASTFVIPGNQSYSCCDYTVEGDYSQMAFFAVLGAIGHSISISNMNLSSLQGDKKILAWVQYTKKDNQIVFQKQDRIAQDFDIADCPDLGPILCVLAAYTKGTSRLLHTRRLRYKECDRISAMEMELKKWGVDIQSDEDSITIRGQSSYEQKDTVIMHSHNDHRIAMACTVFGLCAQSSSILEDAESISKSYPNFFNDIDSL